jgi:hypothetical protein
MRLRSTTVLIAIMSISAVLTADGHASGILADSPPSQATELANLAGRLGIEIVTSDPVFPIATTHGAIEGRSADPADLERYAAIFASEFGRYPAELMRKTNLKRVVLCSELKFAAHRRTAIPDFEHDTLYYDVGRGSYDETYVRKVIHHEFYHLIDFLDDGKLYEDAAWAALNPAGFEYGSGGRNAQGMGSTSLLTDKFSGFLNHYSTTGVEEDKAEIFANLIIAPEYVATRIRADRTVESKSKRMKELMAKFCPSIDAGFWPESK